MPAYHQMGHDSRNLLFEPDLNAFAGAVLSPVNSNEQEVHSLVINPPRSDFEFIFDPQLYFPHAVRGELPGWSYFPSDVDTADEASPQWWRTLVDHLATCVRRFSPSSVCSPAVVPRVFSLDYYAHSRTTALDLRDRLHDTPIEVLQSVLVPFADLSQSGFGPAVASILTGSDLKRAYLVFVTDVPPRRELADLDSLSGALHLIRDLEDAGVALLIGHVSSDLILWKAAGASSAASGKFFNLRRFTPSRWEPAPEGGGQVSYWFEESMMAFLRTSDIVRVRQAGHLSNASMSNPYALRILSSIDSGQADPWLALSWRQYMYWFSQFEGRVAAGQIDAARHLAAADQVWRDLDQRTVLMEERANDGGWIRAWRRVLAEAFP